MVDHGISQELMDEVFAQSKKFFDLPTSEKMKLLRNEKNRGYTPMLDETLDPENQVNGNLFDSNIFARPKFALFFLVINMVRSSCPASVKGLCNFLIILLGLEINELLRLVVRVILKEEVIKTRK